MESRRPLIIVIAGLLALLPVIVFGLGRADFFAGITAVNVVIISASVFLMLTGQPTPGTPV